MRQGRLDNGSMFLGDGAAQIRATKTIEDADTVDETTIESR